MKASLLHDLENGGRLEAPWLCGAVARMSAEAGLDAPGEPRGVRGAEAVREWISSQSFLTRRGGSGSTAPRRRAPARTPEQVAAAADKLAARLAGLPLDAVVVYDIQDETGRTEPPRPVPLTATVDPRDYARVLQCFRPSSTRRSATSTRQAGKRGSTRRAALDFLSIVGRPAPGTATRCRSRAPSAPPAAHAAAIPIGGVVIAERHTAETKRVGPPAGERHRGLRLFHLAGGVPRAAERAAARRLPARLPRRRRRAAAHRPHLRAGRAREDPRLPALARRQRRARDRARDPRRSAAARAVDPTSAATTCAASSTARTPARSRSA